MLINLDEAKDHPRLRGEQIFGDAMKPYIIGSPPLARGTGKAGGSNQWSNGITPACAGNSEVEHSEVV